MDVVVECFDQYFEYCYVDVGAIVIDCYGSLLLEEMLEACFNVDVVFFGVIGYLKYDNDFFVKVCLEQGLL